MKKKSRFSCQDTLNSVERSEKWFRKNVWMDVCACVRRDFEKFKRLYLRNYSVDRIEIWYGGEAEVSLPSI